MKDLKALTKASSFWKAVTMVWQAGLDSFEQGTRIAQFKEDVERLQQELLTVSRLVHDYETKIHNDVRETKELIQAKKELEWGYRALLLENKMLKEEIFKLKGKPLK